MNYVSLEDYCGFTLYDRNTGDPVDVFTIDELKTEGITGDLFISEKGKLYAEGINKMIPIPKGKYLVQFANGMIYGW